ncbi:hypothetical protein [Parafilimonas terrae]|uniref:hypothetical protein n=1 Tax=Parafilimonas terrae TaxID=1465490 RepID=UPI001160C52C|nr:hypothetical protein [Parafilimonas terrae]
MKNILIIENRFKGAYEFYENVKKYDASWSKVHYATNRLQILSLCILKYKAVNFYYYLDFMLMDGLLLYAVPCKNIYVYEEGISAYRKNIFKKTAAYRRRIRNVLGLSEYPGFHPKVKGIYVYNHQRYLDTFHTFSYIKELNPLSFNVPFIEMIRNDLHLALKIFCFNDNQVFYGVRNKNVLLYITSWPLNESFFATTNIDEYDYCIIKPHPHIKELQLPDGWRNNKTIIIESVILVEFLIKILTDKNNTLTIYHHNSSSVMYLTNQPAIKQVINI